MNILLVSPQTPTTFWSLKHAVRFVLEAGRLSAAGPADGGGDAAQVVEPAAGRHGRDAAPRRRHAVGRLRADRRDDRAQAIDR